MLIISFAFQAAQMKHLPHTVKAVEDAHPSAHAKGIIGIHRPAAHRVFQGPDHAVMMARNDKLRSSFYPISQESAGISLELGLATEHPG